MSDIGMDAGPDLGPDVNLALGDSGGSGASELAVYIASIPTTSTFLLMAYNTDWAGNPFSLVSPVGAAISSQTVNSTTQAEVTINLNGFSGPFVLTDGTNTFTCGASIQAPAPVTVSSSAGEF